MGWLWADKSAEQDKITSTSSTAYTPEGPPNAEPPQLRTKPNRKLTRDEQAEAELNDFLKEFQAETAKTSRRKRQPVEDNDDPHAYSQINHSSISPDALYPTSMSCREAFDAAFYCQSFGGQFVNLYRYGGLKECSDHWSKFWFCMRTNRGFMDEEEREKRIWRYYKGQAQKYRTGPSSEDCWELRTERLEDAFEGDLERAERDFAERFREGRE
ncbi:hypothetical protein MMC09_005690 [Bachmanniomyces sp. S44760]|nr:hypothetical protein [Bachmanniomyces sp. S44760]